MRFAALGFACLVACPFLTEAAPRPSDPHAALGSRWNEVEGVWRGTWVRRPGTDTFDATWHCQEHGNEAATLRIRFEQQGAVVVERTQRSQGSTVSGTCMYRGTLDRSGTQVTGRYSCSFGGDDLPWSATIVRP
jgi:hypothetical protein